MGVQPSSRGNQSLSKVSVDVPISLFIGFGQGAFRDAVGEAEVIQFFCMGAQADFDFPQTGAVR